MFAGVLVWVFLPFLQAMVMIRKNGVSSLYVQCCKYPFREYITEGMERNLLEISGKILASINLDLNNSRKIGNLKISEILRGIGDICKTDSVNFVNV